MGVAGVRKDRRGEARGGERNRDEEEVGETGRERKES